jgi:hypothetical protein
LSNFKALAPTYSSGYTSLSLAGWDNGAGAKYWQLSFASTGYENLTLAAKVRSSSTGPGDFKVIYSLNNGTTWTDIPASVYAITSTTLLNFMAAPLSLPAETANAGNVLLRFIMTSNTSSGGATVGSGGTSNINNIVITGTPIQSTVVVGEVTADAAGGAVAAGSKVSLSCATDGASIMYSVNSGEYVQYDPASQITLDTLPATITAYGKKDGMTDGAPST